MPVYCRFQNEAPQSTTHVNYSDDLRRCSVEPTQFPRNFSFVIYVPVQIFRHTFPASPDSHIFTGLIPVLNTRTMIFVLHLPVQRWLGSRVVSVLDSGAERPGFKSQPRRCRVTVLGTLFTPIVLLFTKQQQPS